MFRGRFLKLLLPRFVQHIALLHEMLSTYPKYKPLGHGRRNYCASGVIGQYFKSPEPIVTEG